MNILVLVFVSGAVSQSQVGGVALDLGDVDIILVSLFPSSPLSSTSPDPDFQFIISPDLLIGFPDVLSCILFDVLHIFLRILFIVYRRRFPPIWSFRYLGSCWGRHAIATVGALFFIISVRFHSWCRCRLVLLGSRFGFLIRVGIRSSWSYLRGIYSWSSMRSFPPLRPI